MDHFASSFPLGPALVRRWSDLKAVVHYSRGHAIHCGASLQIGPGQGFKEDRLRKCSAEDTAYAPLAHKSRQTGLRLKDAVCGRFGVGLLFMQDAENE
jgi:hypothetical protein